MLREGDILDGVWKIDRILLEDGIASYCATHPVGPAAPDPPPNLLLRGVEADTVDSLLKGWPLRTPEIEAQGVPERFHVGGEGGRVLVDIFNVEPGSPVFTLGRPMAIREALEGLLEASAAVEAYHKAHWVYRTLNPHSFFRGGASSHLWIFPPAAPERIDLPFKTVLGTPGYIAPEAWRPGKTAVRMDVYSLGAIAYAWVSGEHPFNDVDDVEEIRRLASQGPLPAPPGRGEEIPGPVVNLIRKCTEPHPLDRPRFAADVGRLVRDVLSDISRRQMARTAPEPPKSEKPAPERTREEEQDGEEKKPSRTTRVIPFSLDDIIDETESSS